MKKFLISLAALLAFAAPVSGAGIERGQKTFGIRAGYATINHAPMAGIEFSYAFSPHFVLSPNVDYVFRNERLDALLFNIDYNGPWCLSHDGRLYFYHILGLNYASWSTREPDVESSNDVTTRFNRIGLDFGAGFSFYVTPTLRLSLQGKFNWIKNYNTGLFNLGISYVF